MASIREKKQSNKTVSYHFTCCLGRDARGKQIRRYSTWIPTEGMTPSRARKAAEKAAELWEQQMKAEFDKDLRSPERAKIKELANGKLDFSLFITDVWFPIQIENGEYFRTLNRKNAYRSKFYDRRYSIYAVYCV